MSTKLEKDFKYNVNTAVLVLTQKYLESHKECTLAGALESIGFNSLTQNENTIETVFRMIEFDYIIENTDVNRIISKFDIVKCSFDRYGIVIDINEKLLWGHKVAVQFIGGNPTFIDSPTENFRPEDLIPFIFNAARIM